MLKDMDVLHMTKAIDRAVNPKGALVFILHDKAYSSGQSDMPKTQRISIPIG
jgi:hypothetical protein